MTVFARNVLIAVLVAGAVALFSGCPPKPTDWDDFNVLTQKAPGPVIPSYNGQQLSYDEYMQWIRWGEEWFRDETFGNERFLTDVTGFLNPVIYVPKQGGGWTEERFFKFMLQSIDALDGVRGNLYSGNGGAYTHDLVVEFPPGCMLDQVFPIPQRLHTGLDIEASSPWPLGIVPVPAPPEENSLSYLLDPNVYASGPNGVGADPSGKKYRVGLSCAFCHYSLDVDWDGKTDLQSARLDHPTPGSPYKPQDAWGVGNQDLSIGWMFSLSSNPMAALFASGRPNKLKPGDAREWMNEILKDYRVKRDDVRREILRGVLMMPRGYFDDTPDGIHDPLQYPVLYTRHNWPYNYDGVMLNASDRNNNVWTISFDPSEFVGLCNDRGGKTSKLLFWSEPGIFHDVTANQYAEYLAQYSPAVVHDPAQFEPLRDDILGTSDGIPGVLHNDAVVLVNGVPDAIPKDIMNHPDNVRNNRIRSPEEFGADGKLRGGMVALLGTRVITTPEIREKYGIDALAKKYNLSADEFVTEAVSLMLDWIDPPANHSTLLAKARAAGLVEKGYAIFKANGCVDCHAGPFFTNNTIIPLNRIKTNNARALATEPLQTFVAPEYDPSTGKAISGGLGGIIAKMFGSNERYGYKVVTLRYLWGTAPYLHDGGVAVGLRPEAGPAGDDLQTLLKRADADKVYGAGQVLAIREAQPESYYRANAALSLQALLLKGEREKVIAANKEPSFPVPGTAERVSGEAMNVQGVGHEQYIQDTPGGENITALVAFLLALDDEPGK